MTNLFLIFFTALLFSFFTYAQTPLPPASQRAQILTSLATEMERLDGEALYVRKNRPTSWSQIVKNLEGEAKTSESWLDFMRTLSRLDMSYPNLHSALKPGEAALRYLPQKFTLKVGFTAEWVTRTQVRYVVSRVNSENQYSAEMTPQRGDEILAINGRNINDWKNENFEFCKFSLKEQCDFELPSTFQKELLSWNRARPLSYKLKRGEKIWTIPVGLQINAKPPFPAPATSCKQEKNRYSEFNLVYAGNRACIYESSKHEKTAIFRIMSFNYSKNNMEKDEPIDSISKEISALYPWWVQHATWDHLIFDLIDNHGGSSPVGYYQILFQQEFQEQYVTFKKTKELENPQLRKSIFWDSKGQEIWFQNLISRPTWSQIPYGGYTQPVPMFCADQDQDCSLGLFPVASHPFRGRASVLLNQWCISSCDGFAFNLKEKFGDRVQFFGHPQAADSAYSRMTINLHIDESSDKGFRLEVVPLNDPSSAKAFMSQTVVVTQSTTQDGAIVSGVPVAVDEFVPFTMEDSQSWPNEVLQRALKKKIRN